MGAPWTENRTSRTEFDDVPDLAGGAGRGLDAGARGNQEHVPLESVDLDGDFDAGPGRRAGM